MGLERTVSEGIVSGIRGHEPGEWLQLSAPISPGSSGGGLFDLQGRLVGLTTFTLRESQNLNFAVPIRNVVDLLKHQEIEPVEIPWPTAAETLCSHRSEAIDSAVLLGILGRPVSDSSVVGVLSGFNDGTMPEPQQRFFSKPLGKDIENYAFSKSGVSIICRNGRVGDITLNGLEATEKSSPFAGRLPFGLSWRMPRSEVVRILGGPTSGIPTSEVSGFPASLSSQVSRMEITILGHVECRLSYDRNDKLVQIYLSSSE